MTDEDCTFVVVLVTVKQVDAFSVLIGGMTIGDTLDVAPKGRVCVVTTVGLWAASADTCTNDGSFVAVAEKRVDILKWEIHFYK